MRIISQHKNYSFEFDRAVFWIQYEAVYAKVDGESIMIGKYATCERATEVFEDIHKAYAPVYSISDKLTAEQVNAMLMPSKNVQACHILNAGEETCLTTYDNYVYYMPEE